MQRKRRTIYLAVIGVGLAALVLDRVISRGGPAQAAGAITAPRAGAKPGAPAAAGADRLQLAVPPFPAAQTADMPEPMRDPFALTAYAHEKLSPPPPEVEVSPEAQAARQVAFAERHVLSAVVLMDGSRVAVVDGLSVTTGQVLDGCVAAEIAARSVSFNCPNGETVLHLPGAIGPP